MAKSRRSKSEKALRTQRREKLLQEDGWLKKAEDARMAALQKCISSAPLPVVNKGVEPEPQEEDRGRDGAPDKMDAQPQQQQSSKRKAGKRGVMKVKGKGKKVSALWGKNQLHKKKKKGA